MDVELLLDGFLEFLRLSIAGVPISIAVYLFMEMFKASGIVESDSAKRIAPLVLGLLFAAVSKSIGLIESEELTYKLIVEAAYQAMLGGLFSGLFYTQIVRRFGGRDEEVFDIEE